LIKNQRDYMPKPVFIKHHRVYIHLKATPTKSPEVPQPEVWKLAEPLQEMQNWRETVACNRCIYKMQPASSSLS
jgi:hypothetical protein